MILCHHNHNHILRRSYVCLPIVSMATAAAMSSYTHISVRTIGFDRYYKSLRPRLKPEQCTQTGVNQRHPTDPSLWINCRNIWFNEFWSQHHKCSFEPGADVPCTGDEKLTNYEQEGLVPFVGEWFIFECPPCICFYRVFSEFTLISGSGYLDHSSSETDHVGRIQSVFIEARAISPSRCFSSDRDWLRALGLSIRLVAILRTGSYR